MKLHPRPICAALARDNRNCMRIYAAVVLMTAGVVFGADLSANSYQRSIEQWRSQHEAKLKADNGWLTVVGLDWLKQGENRVGSDPSLEIVLPKSAPARVGSLVVQNGHARFKPASGVPVTLNGKPAVEAELKADDQPKYDALDVGRVRFFVIKRGDKLGVRIKDNDSAARREFTGMRWYPVDPSWRIEAKYIPWDKPRTLTFDTVIGVKEQDESPGYVAFERNGNEYRLEATVDEGQLWFVMRDQTSGKATYAASRFLYADLPADLRKAGTVELDFNKAENPPCVFSNYATCPLPPPQNRLALAITAGEKMYGAQH